MLVHSPEHVRVPQLKVLIQLLQRRGPHVGKS